MLDHRSSKPDEGENETLALHSMPCGSKHWSWDSAEWEPQEMMVPEQQSSSTLLKGVHSLVKIRSGVRLWASVAELFWGERMVVEMMKD